MNREAAGAETAARRTGNRVLVWLFGIALALPGVGLVAGVGSGPVAGENRRLAEAPRLGPGGVGPLLRQTEAWFGDHLGFRRALVAGFNLLSYRAFSTSTSRDVVPGRGRWLFYAQDRIMEDRRGLLPFSESELRRWQAALEQRRDWLARRGVRYVVTIAPEKSSIYPEQLPAALQPPGEVTRQDQLVAWMGARSTVEMVDLRPALRAAKSSDRLYHVTDTHWNEAGAFIAERALEAWLHPRFPALRPLEPAAFHRQVSTRQGGDLAGMLALRPYLPEEVIALVPVVPPSCAAAETTALMKAHAPWQARVFACAQGELGRVVVIHDSFMNVMQPFLSLHFQRSIFVRGILAGELISDERPDLVIEEMVERLLSREGYLPPAELGAP
jgi:alginate O-acetyltransferase complex protein AlgJ